MAQRLSVSSLLGHRQMPFAVACLRSLLLANAEPIRLRLHDDGSLTPADIEILENELDGPEIVPRSVADARVEPSLENRPRCLAWRRANPLALKLIDLGVWGEESIAYCDADILFVRRCEGLFAVRSERALFMRDRQNAYSLRPSHLLRFPALRLAAHVNTGIVVAPRGVVDLDRVEWLLGLPDLQPAVWLEQTCWALLAEGRAELLDDRQFVIPYAGSAGGDADTRAVALHYVSPVRSQLIDRLAGIEPLPPAVERVRSTPARRCGWIGLVRSALVRRLGRLPRSAWAQRRQW